MVAFDRVDAVARRRRGPGRAVAPRRAGWAWACSSTSCPTTSASRRPAANPWWWDVLEHGRESEHADGVRHRLGRSGTARCGSRCSVTTTERRSIEIRDGDDVLRYHDHRFPMAPGTDGTRRARAALRAGRLATRRRRPQLPALLHGHHAWPAYASRCRRSSPRRTSRSAAGSTRASSTACASTTPTACATRRATSTTSPTSPAAPTRSSRRSSSPARTSRRGWAMDGTTGYDALALLDRVLTDPAGRAAADRARRPAARRRPDWHRAGPRPQARRRRRQPAGRDPADRPRAPRPAAARAHERLEDAVAELLACFPVYRSYLPAGREHLDQALRRCPGGTARPGAGRRRPRAGAGRPGGPGRAALPADQRDGDGQGRRGQRVLPLPRGSPRSTRSAATPTSSRSSPERVPRRDGRPGSATGRTR